MALWNKGKFDEESNSWKGERVGYGRLHVWITKKLGRPSLCNRCKTTESKQFVWHNISHKYFRNKTDWERLCASCHTREHIATGEIKMNGRGFKKGQKAWNKGKPNPRARNNPQTFKKGLIPWNVGIKMSKESIEKMRITKMLKRMKK